MSRPCGCGASDMCRACAVRPVVTRPFSELRAKMSPERQGRNREAAAMVIDVPALEACDAFRELVDAADFSAPFGPAPYGPPGGFTRRCRCRGVLPAGHPTHAPCPSCGELPHDDEGLEETRAALTERMKAGGLAVPEGTEP